MTPRLTRFVVAQRIEALGNETGIQPLRELVRTTHGANPPEEMDPFSAFGVVMGEFEWARGLKDFSVGLHMEDPNGSVAPLRCAAVQSFPDWFNSWVRPETRALLEREQKRSPRPVSVKVIPGIAALLTYPVELRFLVPGRHVVRAVRNNSRIGEWAIDVKYVRDVIVVPSSDRDV